MSETFPTHIVGYILHVLLALAAGGLEKYFVQAKERSFSANDCQSQSSQIVHFSIALSGFAPIGVSS